MTRFYSLFILLALLLGDRLYSQTYNVQNFDHKSEIGTNHINTIAEDIQGNIWIGTEGLGVSRFNGENFKFYNNLLSSVGLNINNISFDNDNNIYLSSSNGGFFHSNLDSLQHVQIKPSKDSPGVYYTEIRDDRTLVITPSNITIYSGGKVINQHNFPSPQTIGKDNIYNQPFKVLSSLKLYNFTILFTSYGNFVIDSYEITSLEQWLGTKKSLANSCIHAFVDNNKITFLTKNGKSTINVFLNDDKAKFFYVDSINQVDKFETGEYITFSDRSQKYSYFITNHGRLFKSDGRVIHKLNTNHLYPFQSPTCLLVDINENLWVSSRIEGLYKITLTPFTPVNYNSILTEPDIIFYDEFLDTLVILSRDNEGISYLGLKGQKTDFKQYSFRIYSSVQFQGTSYFGTTDGVYKYKDHQLVSVYPSLKNTSTYVSTFDPETLWIFVEGQGFLDQNLQPISNSPKQQSNFIYADAHSKDQKSHFYGGIGYAQLFKNNVWIDLVPLLKKEELSDVVIKAYFDDRGILWLMSQRYLVGYTPSGEIIDVSDIKWIKSNSTFDFVVDAQGNIILGTSSGIVYLELDNKGYPTYSTLYGNRLGYDVFEVNYNTITPVGNNQFTFSTLEGIYNLDLNRLPIKLTPRAPIIDELKITNNNTFTFHNGSNILLNDDEDLLLSYRVNNPESPVVYYSYRVNNQKNGTWSSWSKDNNALISSSIGPGIYQIDIRASYNKRTSSPVTSIQLKIDRSFFKSEGFVGSLIVILLIINIGYLIRKRQYSIDQIMLSKDLNLHAKTAGFLLLFGAIIILSIFNVAHVFVEGIVFLPILTWITGGATFLLGLSIFIFPSVRKNPQTPTTIGYLLVLGYNIVGAQITNLHPLYILGIVITLIVTPIVITKFRQVISVSIIVLTSSLFVVYTVSPPLFFNDIFFIVDILITLCLVIITTYVRNDALEKLIFTSGVINNEDFLVAAFKSNQEITYLNETFKYLLPKNLEHYVNKNISELSVIETFNQNPFNKVVLEKFRDKSMFNITLELNTGELKHFQFACKVFKNELRVIIGQDITEKIELEKYYEVIVNNSQDLIYRLDISGHLTFVNQQSLKTLGVESEDIIGQFYTNLVHPEWRDEVLDFYSHQFKNRIKNTYSEIPILTKSGEKVWLGQHMTAIFKEGDEKVITGYLGMGRNITDRKRKDEIISAQNKDIRDSINYAKRIQMNLIPDENKVAQYFKESFVYFSPKDIVSGDFYWVERLENKTVLISADCTGHGVPGAFMTLLGINLLNQIILENKILDAGEILNQLDIRLNQALKRNKSEVLNDGMECTVCIIDEEKDTLEYALSGSKFLLYQNNLLQEVNGVSSHIGEGQAHTTPFTSNITSFKEDDIIYLFSDGIVDQFGGEKGKKLKKSRFIKLVDGVKEKDLAQQEDSIKSFMKAWMKNEEQTDDILLIAIKRNGGNK